MKTKHPIRQITSNHLKMHHPEHTQYKHNTPNQSYDTLSASPDYVCLYLLLTMMLLLAFLKRGSHSHGCRGDHMRPKQSPMVAWKSAVKSAKIELYNRSTTESTTTYVDMRPIYDIVVQRL